MCPLGVGLVPSELSPPALRVFLAHLDITLTQTPTSVQSVHMTLTLSLMPHRALTPANPVDQLARVTRFVDDVEKPTRLFISHFLTHNHISFFTHLFFRTTVYATVTVTSPTQKEM